MPELSDQEETAIAMRNLPYWSAAIIRRACETSVNVGGAGKEIIEILDQERVAVDAKQ